jgi:hypothetical protein
MNEQASNSVVFRIYNGKEKRLQRNKCGTVREAKRARVLQHSYTTKAATLRNMAAV